MYKCKLDAITFFLASITSKTEVVNILPTTLSIHQSDVQPRGIIAIPFLMNELFEMCVFVFI